MKYFWLFLGMVFLGGCLTRTYTIEKPRVDLDIKGNQGYLTGTPQPAKKKKDLGSTRKISVVEVEFGSHQGKELKKKEGMISPESFSLDEEIEGIEEVDEVETAAYKESAEKTYKYYTVQKNDTLQKISRKFYGTTKKWKMLYEKNKNTLKSPDKVYPGMKIIIPMERGD
ncbi:MAG: LysM peptidoglycan-binding domain-containing protein [Candidatus Omnitrophota bacterium]